MIEAYNDPELLDDTPIGRLRVVPWGGGAAVAIMDEHEPDVVRRLIHTLEPRENPLNAIYGKRTFEQKAVLAAYNRAVERRLEGEASAAADLSKDCRIDVEKQLQKSWDGGVAEGLARALGLRGRS